MNEIAEIRPSTSVPHRAVPSLSWPVILGLLGFAWPLRHAALLLVDPDTYLHIAAGRWMIAHRALPFQDPFSNSMPGAAWVPHEWLAELLFAAIDRVGGLGAVVLVTTACFGLSIALFARRLVVHCEPFTVLIMVTLTGGLAWAHLLVRPHVLAFPILVAWSAALIDARDADRPPSLRLLPLMVLWANLHGGFMFGLALALYLGAEAVFMAGDAAGRRRAFRRWGVFLVLAILAGLATPNLWEGFLQPFRLMAMPTLQARFSEWQTPNLREDHLLAVWILGVPALGFGLGLRLPVTRLILLLGLFYETFQSGRHTDLLCWVGPLAVAASLGPALAVRIRTEPASGLARWMARRLLPGNLAGSVLAVTLVLAVGAATMKFPPRIRDDGICPIAAVAAARAQHLTGPVLNAESFGGYLIYAGIAPFIDGRIEMYGDAFLERWGRAASGDHAVLSEILDQYHIQWTLFPPASGAVQILDLLPGWHRAYSDSHAIIHVRVDP
jgi:hypothetical protein